MEYEDEIVVTAERVRDGGGGGSGAAWADFWSVSSGYNDGFSFGHLGDGGGGGGGEAPPEEPAPEEPPADEEIVVTAPKPSSSEVAQGLSDWARENVLGHWRTTVDGDNVTLDLYDVLTGQHSTLIWSPDGQGVAEEPYDLDTFVPPPDYNNTLPTGPEVPFWYY